MADAVLRHGGLPFVNAREERCGAEAEYLLQFVADDGDDGVVGKLPDAFRSRSGEEAAQQGAIFGGAVRKFVVDESRGQQAFAFTAGNEKSKAGWERLADFAIVTEADGDGGTVADGGEFGGESGARDREDARGGVSGQGENHGIEVIGFQSRRHRPASGFALNGLRRRVGEQ